jgi:hypothetical protein
VARRLEKAEVRQVISLVSPKGVDLTQRRSDLEPTRRPKQKCRLDEALDQSGVIAAEARGEKKKYRWKEHR